MSAGILSYLRQLLPAPEAQSPDGELLHRFTCGGDQAAFTELLRRHGPLVYGAAIKPVKGERRDFSDFSGRARQSGLPWLPT